MTGADQRPSGCWLVFVLLFGLLTGCATGSPPERAGTSAEERARIYLDLGVSYLRQGQPRQALRYLKKAASLRKHNPHIQNALGLAYQRLHFPQKAEKAFRLALDLAPQEGEVLNNYGVFLVRQGNYDQARRQFRMALANPLYNSPENAYYNLAWLARQQGQLEKAEGLYRTALRLRPSYPEAHLALARLLRAQGRLSDAQKQIQQLLRSHPDHIRGHLLAGELALELGSWAVAREHLARVEELASDEDNSLVRRSHKLLKELDAQEGP